MNGRNQYNIVKQLSFNCCCAVAMSCLTLCNPKDFSMPGFPVLHLSPRVCSNTCPLSQWCHPTISSSVSPFSSCLHSFSASGSFPVSRLFASGGQSIRASASASVLSVNIRGWFPLDWFDLAVQGTLKSLLQHYSSKASVLWCSTFFMIQPSHPYMTTGKIHSFDCVDLCQQSGVSAF